MAKSEILIIDDDREFLEMIEEGLACYQSQFLVQTAIDASSAMAILTREQIAVVVTDLVMPEIGGLDLLAVIKERYPNIPCIVMSGYGSDSVAERIGVDRNFHYIQKPFSIDELAQIVFEELDRRDEGSCRKTILIEVLLQLVEVEQKTCSLEVTAADGRKGVLSFTRGSLDDAVHGDLPGESAAREILTWGAVSFRFWDAPPEGRKKRITRSIGQLILSSAESYAAAEPASINRVADSPLSIPHGELTKSSIEHKGLEVNEPSRLRVMIVDDSKMMRAAISEILSSHPEIEIVGEAEDGIAAMDVFSRLAPDVVTLDVEMPRMDGLKTLKHLMIERPTPVVMVSSLTRDGARETFDALKYGAVDVIAKPTRFNGSGLEAQREEMLRKVRMAAKVKMDSVQVIRTPQHNRVDEAPRARSLSSIVGIGAGEGGCGVLLKLLTGLRMDNPAAYLVSLHTLDAYLDSFARYLDEHCPVSVHPATDGQNLEPGACYLSGGNSYVTVQPGSDGPYLQINPAPFSTRRGSINMMMFSLSEAMGGQSMGIVLSGLGTDGAEGLEEILRQGGAGVVQSPESCMYKEMAAAALGRCGADIVVSDGRMADEINRYFLHHNKRRNPECLGT